MREIVAEHADIPPIAIYVSTMSPKSDTHNTPIGVAGESMLKFTPNLDGARVSCPSQIHRRVTLERTGVILLQLSPVMDSQAGVHQPRQQQLSRLHIQNSMP